MVDGPARRPSRRSWVRILAVTALVASAVVLVGHATATDRLVRLRPGWPSMTAPTATGVAALAMARLVPPGRLRRALTSATAIIAIGSFVSQLLAIEGLGPWTPSSPTAASFLFLVAGTALEARSATWARNAFGVAAGIAYVTTIAYLTDASALYFVDLGFATNGMSVPTAASVAALALAGLLTVLPPARVPVARFLRLALAVTLVVPLVAAVIGALVSLAPETRATLVLTVHVGVLLGSLAWLSRHTITETVRATAAEEAMRAIMADMTDAVLIVDGRGRLIEANDQAVALFGYPYGRLLGMTVEDLVPERFRGIHRNQRQEYLRAANPRDMSDRGDLVARRADGTYVDIRVSLSPVRSRTGARQVAATVVDVTRERTALREEQDRARHLTRMLEREHQIVEELRELDRTKDLLLSAISHELRTPLTVVRGFAETLVDRFSVLDREQQEELLRRLRAQTIRLDNLLGDLLDIERLRRERATPNAETVAVDIAVAEAIETARQAFGRDIIVEAEPASCRTPVRHIERIVDNLLSNAAKYAPEGPIHVRIRSDENWALIEVEDHGPGVPIAFREQIFRPFERGAAVDTARPGIGIGLALVQRLCLSQGGSVEVGDGPLAGGALFRVRLPTGGPASPARSDAMAAAEPTAEAAPQNPR